MNYRRLNLIAIMLTISIFIFFSCVESYNKGSSGGSRDNGGINNPPIITTAFKPDANNIVQFSTNDPSKLSSYGKTYWYPYIFNNATDNHVELDCAKNSGKPNYGYGVIFCIQDPVVDSSSPVNNFYALLVRVDGYYELIKVAQTTDVNGKIVPKQHRVMLQGSDSSGWKYSSLLYTGYGVNNKIRINYIGKDGNNYSEFEIYFNDQPEIVTPPYIDNFTLDTLNNNEILKAFDGDAGKNKYGFIVTLGPDEDFPITPVSVSYNLLYPAYTFPKSNSMVNKSISYNTDSDLEINLGNF